MRTARTVAPSADALAVLVLLVLAFFLLRATHLAAFPPFLDEMQHVDFAERLTTVSPLANASEGRLLTFWWLNLFQPYAQAAVWTARIAAIIGILPGFAAILSIGWISGRLWAAGLTAMLAAGCLYLDFFQRLALADPLSTSAVLVAVALCYRLKFRLNPVDAAAAGVALFLAVGLKVTALPYLAVPVAAALALPAKRYRGRDVLTWLAIALVAAGGLTLVYLLGLRLFGYNALGLAEQYNQSMFERLSSSVTLAVAVLSEMLGTYAGALGIAIAAVALLGLAWKREWYLLLCLFAPLLVLVLNQRQGSRYLITAASLLVLCTACGLVAIAGPRRRVLYSILLIAAVWAGVQIVTRLSDTSYGYLSATDQAEYVHSDASGEGLDEVLAVIRNRQPETVIGLLANCQAIRYALLHDVPVTCPNINPDGSTAVALTTLITGRVGSNTLVIAEDSSYIPADLPGIILAEVRRGGAGPALRVLDLSAPG